jgi:hypothetical protein
LLSSASCLGSWGTFLPKGEVGYEKSRATRDRGTIPDQRLRKIQKTTGPKIPPSWPHLNSRTLIIRLQIAFSMAKKKFATCQNQAELNSPRIKTRDNTAEVCTCRNQSRNSIERMNTCGVVVLVLWLMGVWWLMHQIRCDEGCALGLIWLSAG